MVVVIISSLSISCSWLIYDTFGNQYQLSAPRLELKKKWYWPNSGSMLLYCQAPLNYWVNFNRPMAATAPFQSASSSIYYVMKAPTVTYVFRSNRNGLTVTTRHFENKIWFFFVFKWHQKYVEIYVSSILIEAVYLMISGDLLVYR